MKPLVAILHDTFSDQARIDEQDALVQADVVRDALEEIGFETRLHGVTLDLRETARLLESLQPDGVFNLVESIGGKGRLIHLAPAVVESMGIPCTGASSEAMLQTSNKLVSKRILSLAAIPTPFWIADGEVRTGFEPGRYIVKSVWEEWTMRRSFRHETMMR